MFCTACGAQAIGDQRFCGSCGRPLAQGQQSQQQPTQQPQQQFPPVPMSAPAAAAAPSPVGTFMSPGRVDVGLVTFLSVITFGIYWMVWVYGAMKEYRAHSGRVGRNLEQLFWGMVIALGVAVVLGIFTVVLWFVAVVAYIVIAAFFVYELMLDRDAIAARLGIVGLPTVGMLLTLSILANVFSATFCGVIIGIPLGIWFYIEFFRGHNRIVEAGGLA